MQLVIVDTETSSLNPDSGIVVEVAWRNLDTLEEGVFVPPHDVDTVLAHGDPESLRINRYRGRLVTAQQDLDGQEWCRLANSISDELLVGCNPTFDIRFLNRVHRQYQWYGVTVPPLTPHYRPLDLSAYACGVLGIHPRLLPGSSSVYGRLGVVNRAPHTAAGDVDVCDEALQMLVTLADQRAAAGEGTRA